MRAFSKKGTLVGTIFSLLLHTYVTGSEIETLPASDWREEYAYTLGMQAYIFGFPWIFLPEIRWKWVSDSDHSSWSPHAPLNQFWNARALATAAYIDGGSPNEDTLYSIAWLDLKEPIILSVPDVKDRYYTMQMASMDSDNFAYVGTRTTGTKAGNYAIVGPNWKGKLPKGIQLLPPSRTSYALIMGRTLVFGKDDLPNVHKIQDQYKLTPLSLWDKKTGDIPQKQSVWEPYNSSEDPLANWQTMNRAMTENPPEESLESLLHLFSKIGLGPNQTVEKLDEASKKGLARAAKDGLHLLREVIVSGMGKEVNGWRYPSLSLGRAGLGGNFLVRAAFQCLEGIVANDPQEATYIMASHDDKGERLSGAHNYVIHFAPGGLPKVDAFWSITMYGLDNNLVSNPINRYKIGTYPQGALKFDADGGLTIYIQNKSPGPEKEPEWLPAPTGEFYLLLRTYMPREEIVQQKWDPPAIQKLDGPAS